MHEVCRPVQYNYVTAFLVRQVIFIRSEELLYRPEALAGIRHNVHVPKQDASMFLEVMSIDIAVHEFMEELFKNSWSCMRIISEIISLDEQVHHVF